LGSAILTVELTPKRLQMLRELMPKSLRFGLLADPANPVTPSLIPSVQAAASTLGLEPIVGYASTDSDLETAFTAFSQQRVGAVLVGSSTFYNGHPEQLTALAARYNIVSLPCLAA
jgi:putative ABC transport system substrate-binding protein